MKLEVEKKQVMKKCHYCLGSTYDGECPFKRFDKARLGSCAAALQRLVEAEKGGAG